MAKSGWKETGTGMRLAFLLFSTVGLAAAQDDAVFRSNVQLVRILATVKDQSGALVGSLE